MFAGSEEIDVYERLKRQAGKENLTIPDYVKHILEKVLKKNA